MRKVISLCVLMMILLPLSGCLGGDEGQENLDLALTLRGEYLAMENFSAQAELTADYGQRVYEFGLSAVGSDEETVLTVTAPEPVAGITARLKSGKSFLEYDELSIETGRLTQDGLSPVSAIPALLEAVRSGYITACGTDDSGAFRVDYGAPDTPPGTGTEYVLWFDSQSHVPLRGEVSKDGVRCIECTFSSFTKE